MRLREPHQVGTDPGEIETELSRRRLRIGIGTQCRQMGSHGIQLVVSRRSHLPPSQP
jgi:hypothetical protein